MQMNAKGRHELQRRRRRAAARAVNLAKAAKSRRMIRLVQASREQQRREDAKLHRPEIIYWGQDKKAQSPVQSGEGTMLSN